MKNYNEDSHPIESHRRHSGYSQSRILEIERAERAEFLELLHRVERLYNSRSRQIDEIRKRMGFSVHQDTLTSPQTTASPILKDDKRVRTFRTNQTMVEEEPFSKKRLGLGSKMAGWNAANRRNPRTHASLSSVDMPTPTELRAISKVSLFTPSPPSSPPPRATRRPSCLPKLPGTQKRTSPWFPGSSTQGSSTSIRSCPTQQKRTSLWDTDGGAQSASTTFGPPPATEKDHAAGPWWWHPNFQHLHQKLPSPTEKDLTMGQNVTQMKTSSLWSILQRACPSASRS
ncbi:uncharacterized protein LOC116675325 [Etheostoma spectabile]|uniref:uncharacterized protein LOC116675325 n=1 Tax=Etheostoma spectabile TaxID=54343 RepID=UPI0013AF5E64|nr:uncharacterized protein LOC116675325 [Etheostoma spectabile]